MEFHGLPQGILKPPVPLPPDADHEDVPMTGTLTLVYIFLAAFAIYYFVNWKLLSVLWQIG